MRNAIILVLTLIFTVTGFFVYLMLFEYEPPQFFSLNDQKATYTIKKDNGFYTMHYSGKSEFKINSVMIGKSDIDLASFEEKPVQVRGSFVNAKQQCIVKYCTDFEGSTIVLNIDSITQR